MLTLTSNISLEKIEKFRQALYEDLKKDKPYLVSAIASKTEKDTEFVFLDGIEEVEKQINYLLLLSSSFLFFNRWIPGEDYALTFLYEKGEYKYAEQYLRSNKLKVLTKDKIKEYQFRYCSTFRRVDFKFSYEDMRKLFSFYVEEDQSMEVAMLLECFHWPNL